MGSNRPATRLAELVLRTGADRFVALKGPSGSNSPSPSESVFRWLRNLQHLTWLDFVRVAQLILVGVEDRHVRTRVAKLFSGNFAQCVARLHCVGGLSRCAS